MTRTEKGSVKGHGVSPTKLIGLVENRKWKELIQRCADFPQEASTYKRINVDGVKRKFLPLHLAIVLNAPVEVIAALVDAYPDGTKISDDKKMLPLHMAFGLGASPETAAIIVQAYPDALTMKDSRGHTPCHILKAYRREYAKKNIKDNRLRRTIDRRRIDLIHIYIGNGRSKNNDNRRRKKDYRVLEEKLPAFTLTSGTEYDSSGTEYDSASSTEYDASSTEYDESSIEYDASSLEYDESSIESEDEYDSIFAGLKYEVPFSKDVYVLADFRWMAPGRFSNILRDSMTCH